MTLQVQQELVRRGSFPRFSGDNRQLLSLSVAFLAHFSWQSARVSGTVPSPEFSLKMLQNKQVKCNIFL